MKKLIHDIHNGKNVKENLKVYHNLAVQTYSEYSMLELTFSAYTLLEEIMEERTELAEKESESIDAVLQALGEVGKENCVYAEVVEVMKSVREMITAKMDFFTACTDRLICYEYVLNRMELKFLSKEELEERCASVNEEEYLQHLGGYLFGSKDQSVIRDKLRMVISQVPVHMTKSKLFEKIGEALTLYKGGDRSSLDDFIYMIRTSAMVYETKQYAGEYASLEKALGRLETADYIHMTEGEYEEITQVLEIAAESVHEFTDFYYSLQKVVNGIYAVCLVFPYVEKESSLIRTGRSIWSRLAVREYQSEMLFPLEGRIEQCVERSSYLESVLFEIKSAYQKELEELSLTSFFEDISLIANLLSDSLFIDLEKVAEEKVADADYVQKCTAQLLDELAEKMGQLSRPVKRAVMGQILDKLPMTFQNTEEVLEYIRVNLLGCQDKAEKVIVMEMLLDLMQEEQEWEWS